MERTDSVELITASPFTPRKTAYYRRFTRFQGGLMSKINKSRQISEIVKCGKDPVYFFNSYIKIQHPVRGLIKFDTYPFQDECVDEIYTRIDFQ